MPLIQPLLSMIHRSVQPSVGGVAKLGALCGSLGSTAMLVFLMIGVALGLGITTENLLSLARGQGDSAISSLQGCMAIAVALAACGGSWMAARRERPYSVIYFLVGLLLASLCVRGLLVQTVDSQWSTDYLRYWQHAVAMAARAELSLDSLYDQRALLVAYPVARAFGPDAQLVLKMVNVGLFLAIQLMAYDLMRLARNHQAAQAMSILLLAAPMPAYVTLIPSHDLWGLFFLTVALWAACRAAYLFRADIWSSARVVVLTLLCSAATYCLELQRSVGTLYALVFCLAAAIGMLLRVQFAEPRSEQRMRSNILLAVALACLLTQPLLARVGSHLGVHPATAIAEQSSHKMKFAAHAGAMGTATSDWYARFRDRFHDKATQGPEAVSEFARSLALSSWIIQPQGKLQHLAAHMPRLFDLGYPADWDTALRRPTKISATTHHSLIFYAGVFGVAFGLMLVAALTTATISGRVLAPPVLIISLFVGALSFLLLLLFENKAPNIFPIWLAGSMLIAWVASSPSPTSADPATPIFRRTLALLTILALLAAVLTIAWLAARTIYSEDDGRTLADWDLTLQQSAAPPPEWEEALRTATPRAFEAAYFLNERRGFVLRGAPFDGPRIEKYSGDLLSILEFPAVLAVGDKLSMSRRVCGATSGRDLEFFVFSPFNRRDVTNSFSLDVVADGRGVKHMSIPFREKSMQLVTVEDIIGNKECHEISITITSNVARTAASWIRASRVEIWFPRLIANP